MSEIELPAPKPPRSRLGTPRAELIDGAGAGDGDGDGDAEGDGDGDDDGDGADAVVVSVFVDDDPPPPQAATPALRKAIATRRACDVVFSAGGIFFLLMNCLVTRRAVPFFVKADFRSRRAVRSPVQRAVSHG